MIKQSPLIAALYQRPPIVTTIAIVDIHMYSIEEEE